MHGNATVYRANIVKFYKEAKQINDTVWQVQSPDMNIIENIWLKMKRDIENETSNVNTPQLFDVIRGACQDIPVDYVRGLYETIPGRLREVLRMKGHLTKYQGKTMHNYLRTSIKVWSFSNE